MQQISKGWRRAPKLEFRHLLRYIQVIFKGGEFRRLHQSGQRTPYVTDGTNSMLQPLDRLDSDS